MLSWQLTASTATSGCAGPARRRRKRKRLLSQLHGCWMLATGNWRRQQLELARRLLQPQARAPALRAHCPHHHQQQQQQKQQQCR